MIAPTELWRLVSIRQFCNQELRHTNFFTTESAAKEHAEWVESIGGRVLSLSKYVLQ